MSQSASGVQNADQKQSVNNQSAIGSSVTQSDDNTVSNLILASQSATIKQSVSGVQNADQKQSVNNQSGCCGSSVTQSDDNTVSNSNQADVGGTVKQSANGVQRTDQMQAVNNQSGFSARVTQQGGDFIGNSNFGSQGGLSANQQMKHKEQIKGNLLLINQEPFQVLINRHSMMLVIVLV